MMTILSDLRVHSFILLHTGHNLGRSVVVLIDFLGRAVVFQGKIESARQFIAFDTYWTCHASIPTLCLI